MVVEGRRPGAPGACRPDCSSESSRLFKLQTSASDFSGLRTLFIRHSDSL